MSLWEPWQPAIDQRVRIHLSAECPNFHESWEDGKIGSVAQKIDWDVVQADMLRTGEEPITEQDRTHPYAVEFDEPRLDTDFITSFGPIMWGEGLYAAGELIPLDD